MKVLFVTQSIYPLSGGRSLASYGYITEYQKHCDLTLASPVCGDAGLKDETRRFCESRGIKAFLVPATPNRAIFEKMREASSRILAKLTMTVPVYHNLYREICDFIVENAVDLVIVDHIGMSLYFKKLHSKFPKVRFIYNAHNVEFRNTEDELITKAGSNPVKRLYARFRCRLRKKLEQYMIINSEHVFCISRNDMAMLAKEFGYKEKYIFSKPLIQFPKTKSLDDVQEYHHKLMIVGSMNWYPNVKGIIWFVENVFKKLHEKDSELKLFLVGSKPTPEIKALASENIIVTGFVDSTEPYFKECDISIIPVFEGTGAKIKVLESIARGIPTVCADFAAKDYDLSDAALMRGTTAEEFVEAITVISKSSEIRKRLYEQMSKYYFDYFHLSCEVVDVISGENHKREHIK